MTFISDAQRNDLLRELKPLARWDVPKLRCYKRDKRNERLRLSVRGDAGHEFGIAIRKAVAKRNAFSVVLRYFPASGAPRNLIRCDGWQSEHTNKLEALARESGAKIPPNTPHVHILTERYQLKNRESPVYVPDEYAEPVSDYHDYESAYEFFRTAFGFYKICPETRQRLKTLPLLRYPFCIDTFDD